MCGIAGIVTDGPPVDPRVLGRMADALRHRGPDGEGTWTAGAVGLTMRRLVVIDPEHGDQPVTNEDGTIVAVVNGEVYNHHDLRRDLVRRGHRFAGGSDVEVVVHLYEDHGPACLHALRGMFAIALWDARRGELLLARDAVGKKPLVYAWDGSALRFGSEPRAVLQDPAVPRTIDTGALDAFLTNGYVPHDRSAYAALEKLPPGGRLRWRPGHGAPAVERWWSPPPPEVDHGIGLEEGAEQVREALLDATRVRLGADVPLGAFLSGGVDSGAVVAAMARLSARPVETFSVAFDDAGIDESAAARRVAEHLGCTHHELELRALDAGLLTRLAWHTGEPLADPAALATLRLSEQTRRHVTVVLTGDGGDEAFAGYKRYRQLAWTRPAEVVPVALRRRAATLLRTWAGGTDGRAPLPRSARLAARLTLDPAARYAALTRALDDDARRRLYGPVLRDAAAHGDPIAEVRAAWDRAPAGSWVDRAMAVDRETYLPDDLLPKTDLTTMAHGLEARCPLLDTHLLAVAQRLPPALRVRGSVDKRVLRAAVAGWLPPGAADAPKHGFELPIGAWLRGPLAELSHDVLLDQRARDRGVLDHAAVTRLLADHRQGADRGLALWTLLSLELWFRTCVDVADVPLERVPVVL